MERICNPGSLQGTVAAIPSKSQAHRLLICAAFADQPTTLICPATNRDIQATAQCLSALGANIQASETGYHVTPIWDLPQSAALTCGESGSTLRFLLPIAGALGVDATFLLEGRLSQRPLSPLWEEMERMGCQLTRPTASTLRCRGKLRPGDYSIAGNVSSQFVTGLLFALSLVDGHSSLRLTGTVESEPYIRMTLQAMEAFGLSIHPEQWHFSLSKGAFRSPETLTVEGDWSNAAFWLAARSLGSKLTVTGLDPGSAQGDRACAPWLDKLDAHQTIDVTHIPDLVPILAVVAGAKAGAVFENAHRLRLKETDRLETTAAMLRNLGGKVEISGNSLIVHPTGYTGGTVDATGDHRIAMAAAIAATVCTNPVTILGAEAVEKSYPGFWRDYETLGGSL